MSRYHIKYSFPNCDHAELVKLISEPDLETKSFTVEVHIEENEDYWLFPFLADFYQFGVDLFKSLDGDGSTSLKDIAPRLGTIILTNPNQDKTWSMQGCWPHAVNFGYLCYSESADLDIEIAWKFQVLTIESPVQ